MIDGHHQHDDEGSPTEPAMPESIGGYLVQRVLGSGGMATVYAALQRQPRRTVAIKVLRGAPGSAAAARRFKQEIEILGRLRHPFVAQVYGAGVHEEHGVSMPYYVMEYVPRARSILEYAAEKDLDLERRLRLFVKVCAAVDHGHRRKVVHRDLKPGNILIDENGDPKVIDFGVARALELPLGARTMDTEIGRLVGTVQYMAPEQVDPRGHDLDARCDVYALGVILYRLVTGRPPYELASLPLFTAAQVIREERPPPPSAVQAGIPRDLDAIVMKALEKSPRERYRSAASLGRDLLRHLAALPVHARGGGALYRLGRLARRKRVEVIAGATILAVIAAAAAIVLAQRGDGPPLDPAAVVPLARDAEPSRGSAGAAEPVTTEEVERAEGAVPAGAAPASEPLTLHAGGPVSAIAFDGEGRRLAAAAAGGRVAVFDLLTHRAIVETTDHDDAPVHVAFAGAADFVASAGADGRVVVLDVARNRITAFESPCAPPLALAGGPDDGHVVLACADLTVRLLDREGRPQQVLRGAHGAFRVLALDGAGARLAGGADRGDVTIWSGAGGSIVRRATGAAEVAPLALAIGADGAVSAAYPAGIVLRWDAAGAASEVDLGAGAIVAAAIGAGGRVVLARADGALYLRDLDGPRTRRVDERALDEIIVPGEASAPAAIAVSPDGRWWAAAGAGGRIRVVPIPAPGP
jgi:hypothetical protein